MKSKSPSYDVVDSYINLENSMFDILQIIPYCKEHENVWSPKLVPVLRETCSELASLWHFEAKKSQFVPKNNLKITHFFLYFGEKVASKWVVFWAKEPEIVKPYENWTNIKEFEIANYKPLDWWTAYTEKKHEGLSDKTRVTLKLTMYSLAGLFLAILKSGSCFNAINQAGWIFSDLPNPEPELNDEHSSEQKPDCYFTVESKLFSYPVGWSKVAISPKDKWHGTHSSPRFIEWFDKFTNQSE